MKIEIKIDKEIIDFCKLNELDLPTFIYDCLEKGYVQNKWGKSPLDSADSSEIVKTPKKRGNNKKKEDVKSKPNEQKKSEPVKQAPINDLYGED